MIDFTENIPVVLEKMWDKDPAKVIVPKKVEKDPVEYFIEAYEDGEYFI